LGALPIFQSSFIQVEFFGGYFLAGLSRRAVMEKIGYKERNLAVLFFVAAGGGRCISFCRHLPSGGYGFFLFALFVMGAWRAEASSRKSQGKSSTWTNFLGPAG